MYAMSDNEDVTAHLIKEFMEEFKEEKKFIEYFQKIWCYDESRIGKIIKVILNIFYVFIQFRLVILYTKISFFYFV